MDNKYQLLLVNWVINPSALFFGTPINPLWVVATGVWIDENRSWFDTDNWKDA